MRVIALMMFALFFALGGLCTNTNSPGTPPGEAEGGTEDPDKPPASVSSPADEGQKENLCQFKEDHVVSEIGGGWFSEGKPITVSGPSFVVKGSDKPTKLVEVIDEGGVAGFGKGLSKKQFQPAEGGGVVLSYEYIGDDYKDWCPTSGEQCIVEVIYRGVDGESIYKKEKTHPRAPASHYVYTGNLTIQILFSGRVLDFSNCN